MTEIRLSFVIPARNEEALISESLEAILASVAHAAGVRVSELWLPDTSFEVVVADDESEDATPAIVRSFGQAAGELGRHVLHDQNGRPLTRRQLGNQQGQCAGAPG